MRKQTAEFFEEYKTSLASSGYLQIWADGKTQTLHRLLAKKYVPNPENKPCVNHKDGDKLNNDISNLEWCTHAENTTHAYKIGLSQKGERHGRAKLSQRQVNGIKSAIRLGTKQKDLAKIFNVSREAISAINKGKNWKGIEDGSK